MLEDLRKEIDECDSEIIRLLKRRMEISREIGKIKKENNLPLYDGKREEALMEKLKGMSSEILSKETIDNIYREILFASKELQNRLFY